MKARRVAWGAIALVAVQLLTCPAALAAPSPDPSQRSTPKPGGTPEPKPSKKKRPSPQPPPQRETKQECEIKTGIPASQLQEEPWAQKRLGFTAVWELTTGKGVTVAVVDSGVDASHPQLKGRVRTIDVTGTGTRDCLGHGTQAAGIIAARDMRRRQVPFLGVAPGVRLLSIKAAVQQSGNDPGWTAKAIREAADRGAKVINVSSQSPDYPSLREAVKYAQRKDAVIVAAAGNIQDEQRGTQTPAYPAAYPGVVAVGAVGESATLSSFSNTETPVTVVAPGEKIVSTWPGGGYNIDQGTSFATPFVSGVAALVRSYHPKLSYKQVKRRLEVTADGGSANGTGGGMVNPLQAVTAVLDGEEEGEEAPSPQALPVYIPRPEAEDRFGRTLALSLTGGALALAASAVAAGIIIPAGRRRNWRPSRRQPSTEGPTG